MKKKIFLLRFLLAGILWIPVLGVQAQQAVLDIDFEKLDKASITAGIAGKALDLGPDAPIRRTLAYANPLSKSGDEFSVTVWAKSAIQSKADYVLLSALTPSDSGYNGWKIGVHADGAWYFEASKGATKYDYSPMVHRQNIRDGNWHLLGVTYNGNREELTFYFDGKMMAIYRADGIRQFGMAKTLVVGGSEDHGNYQKTGDADIFWETFNGCLDDIHLYAGVMDRDAIAGYYQSVMGSEPAKGFHNHTNLLNLTTFNIWHGANTYGKETGRKHLIEILKKLDSDVYTLVETYGSGPYIADALGYYLYLISSNLSIVSRYPIVKTYPLRRSFNSGGAQIELESGKKINLFPVWLDWRPAFHSNSFTNNEGWSFERYMQEEENTRGRDIKGILEDIQPYLRSKDSIPVIVAGDFNSGSHLDHTEATKKMHHGYIIPWPVSKAMEKTGFHDSFREIHPDPLQNPGLTFSPVYNNWMNERIDYIYYQGKGLKPIFSQVIDSHPVKFPSDHATVNTIFMMESPK